MSDLETSYLTALAVHRKAVEILEDFKTVEADLFLIRVLLNDGRVISYPYIANPKEMAKMGRRYNGIGIRRIIACEIPPQNKTNTENK